MNKELIIKEWIRVFFGLAYVVSHHRKEIHLLKNKKVSCSLQYLSPNNAEYVTKTRAYLLIRNYGYKGCRWCWKSKDE